MNLLDALILGIVEGLTEFLPVSSTGHLILTARLLGLEQTEFIKSFEIAIQLGAILAVIALYGRRLVVNREISKHVLAAFLPTAVIGLILYKIIKKFLLGNDQVVLWALFVGGIFLIGFSAKGGPASGGETTPIGRGNHAPTDIQKISYRHAVLIGLCQSLAIIPGVSRSAATIVGGLALGLERKTIVEFSFLLAVPTMLAATGLDLLKNALAFTPDQLIFLLTGFTASLLVAMLSIRFLVGFIQNHTFIPFGVWRVLLALSFWGLLTFA